MTPSILRTSSGVGSRVALSSAVPATFLSFIKKTCELCKQAKHRQPCVAQSNAAKRHDRHWHNVAPRGCSHVRALFTKAPILSSLMEVSLTLRTAWLVSAQH
jgi:type II secretory ATPase GspE/PulE/Tfp pilus assembly ATPase PilB-like protein